VAFSVSSGPGSITGGVLSVTGAGTVVVTASQSGNSTYSPAPAVRQSFAVAQAPLTIVANNLSILNNGPIPQLTFAANGLVNGDTVAVLNEAPAISTTATAGSPPGTYPISVGPLGQFGDTMTATNYIINGFVAGTLTITAGGPVQDFTPTLSTPALTILDGQVGQLTLTISPLNYYGGTINLSCTGLPANVTCVFSPPTINAALTYTGTLTIATSNSTIVASLPQSDGGVSIAAISAWVSLFFGLAFAWQRKRLVRHSGMRVIAITLSLCSLAVCLTACGGSSLPSPGKNFAARGTSTIQIVATDASSGVTHSIPLSITIK
jgi:hypothetical protein